MLLELTKCISWSGAVVLSLLGVFAYFDFDYLRRSLHDERSNIKWALPYFGAGCFHWIVFIVLFIYSMFVKTNEVKADKVNVMERNTTTTKTVHGDKWERKEIEDLNYNNNNNKGNNSITNLSSWDAILPPSNRITLTQQNKSSDNSDYK